MANTNKYAELPGFAFDQPDVFETSDLPESDQNNLEGFGDQSETVEKVSISTSEAYEKFKDQKLDASGVDFTDSIKKTKHSGYSVTSGDWELIGSGSPENETFQQRYQRLKHETTELFEEIDKLKQSSKLENEGGIAITDLSKNVESLQHQILNLNLQKVLGSELIANISDPHGVLQKKLIVEIESFKPSDAKTGKPTQTKADSKDDFIQYNLLYKPTDSQTGISAKATDLEGRIKKLEALLGSDDKKLTLLTPQGQAKSLLASIDFLSSRLSLLDPGNLEKVEARLSYLNQHLQQIAEKKSQLDLEKQNKVSELYDLAKKTESMSNSLPKALERLDSLQQLHEQAMQFSQALTQLDNVQQQIFITLKNDEKMMKEAQESFAKNSEIINKNVTFLDQRVSKLEPN